MVSKLATKYPTYSSFLVVCDEIHKDATLNPNQWEEGVLVLNVYLSYYSADSFDLYLLYVGKIAAILEQCLLSHVMILGDFNANVDNRFFRE